MQEFSSRGVQVRQTKKSLTTFFLFFSPKLILQKSNGQFQRNLSFFKVPNGVQHFPGGVQLFPGGGGSNCLFPIETHITFQIFQGGGGSVPPVPPPPPPPLDQHLVINSDWVYNQTCRLSNVIQGSHRLEKYLNIGFFEKSLKIKYALKSTIRS